MSLLIAIVNVFFMPCISINIILRRYSGKISAMRIFSEYGTMVAVLMLFCRMADKVLMRFMYIAVPVDSVKYSIISAFLALMLPYVREFFCKSFRIKLNIEEREEKIS